MSTVGISRAGSRKDCIRRALDIICNETRDAVRRKDSDTLFIKLHVNDGYRLGLSTHPDALKTVVEYFAGDFDHVIAGDTNLPFLRDNIYADAGEIREMEFSDMRDYDSIPLKLLWADGSEKPARISLLPASVFTISLSLPQIHECLAFSGCTENMAGCVVKNKKAFHGVEWWSRFSNKRAARGNRAANMNLMRVLNQAKPDISVLDFYSCGKKAVGISMASDDCVSADAMAARAMGMQYVPHLSIAQTVGLGVSKMEMIQVALDGVSSWSEVRFPVRPHYSYMNQIASHYRVPLDFRHPFYAARRIRRLRDMRIEERLEKDVL
ncbi:MAG: DUF362 domain-containing protein [Candidatus Aenigmarchaeota archaeon]|nr:DUF362 domain-containing protein [Candidatus Aenigmarchaeota archaeon]